ncbi:hypothetical protein [Aliarcobacter butzleri]|uniref:hypothetical protein n=1 Tax=Aliarcobacter butzleri TaxID=28197 RepID=UPI002B2559DB|nr:hypothetical protein [Aliarcobacter butzleri]
MDTFIDKTKKNIVKDIINCFKEGPKANVILLKNNKRKIMIKKLLEQIKKQNNFIILENYKPDTQEWKIAYADITLIKKHNDNIPIKEWREEDYKYIGFDIIFDLIEGIIYKRIFINFSFHALIRFIERCNIEELSTPDKVKKFLSSMLKPILLRSLSMYEDFNKEFIAYKTSNPNSNEFKFQKSESYVFSNNLCLPIALEIVQNIFGTRSLAFTIKTIMPDSYRGARKIKEEDLAPLKQKIFDYSHLLLPLIVQKH